MVERPIKKSERQPKVNADNNSENSDSMPLESNPRRSKQSDDRSSARGKKGSFANESKQQVNPALARGPKPVKPKANVIIEPETESEPVSEESQGEATEG